MGRVSDARPFGDVLSSHPPPELRNAARRSGPGAEFPLGFRRKSSAVTGARWISVKRMAARSAGGSVALSILWTNTHIHWFRAPWVSTAPLGFRVLFTSKRCSPARTTLPGRTPSMIGSGWPLRNPFSTSTRECRAKFAVTMSNICPDNTERQQAARTGGGHAVSRAERMWAEPRHPAA